MKSTERPDYSVRAVNRVCDILDLLRLSTEGASQTKVATASGLPKSSALRYLATLEARKYIERDPHTGLYGPGSVFGVPVTVKLESMRRLAVPLMEKLRDELQETVNLGVLDGEHVRYLQIVESPRAVRLAARYHERDPLHSTALGKAIAISLSEAHVRSILEKAGMPAFTVHTIISVEEYFAELAKVRSRRYSLDDAENIMDGRCAAVPIDGLSIPAALSVSAPAERFSLEHVHEALPAMHRTATAIADAVLAEPR
jgi:IclR family acetate operon transcriptional repressor